MSEKKRVTQHSGRTHRNGQTYSVKHNDRNFESEAYNIDRGRTRNNTNWTWCKDSEDEELQNLTFDEAELLYYTTHFQNQLNLTNEKYKKSRHKERVTTMDKWRKQKKHAPEEVIIQIGKMGNTIDADLFKKCFEQYIKELNRWSLTHGNCMQILDWSIHQDERGAPHAHIRRVWQYHNADTHQLEIGQEKALELAGVQLPYPDGYVGLKNNRKITFDREMRTVWVNIAKENGLEIETEPLPTNEVGMSLDQRIRKNEEERQALLREAELLKEQNEKKQEEINKTEEKQSNLQLYLDEREFEIEDREKAVSDKEAEINMKEEGIRQTVQILGERENTLNQEKKELDEACKERDAFYKDQEKQIIDFNKSYDKKISKINEWEEASKVIESGIDDKSTDDWVTEQFIDCFKKKKINVGTLFEKIKTGIKGLITKVKELYDNKIQRYEKALNGYDYVDEKGESMHSFGCAEVQKMFLVDTNADTFRQIAKDMDEAGVDNYKQLHERKPRILERHFEYARERARDTIHH